MQAEELWNHFIEEYPRYKHHTYEAWQVWRGSRRTGRTDPPGREDRHYFRVMTCMRQIKNPCR